jgi:hypothetical protein
VLDLIAGVIEHSEGAWRRADWSLPLSSFYPIDRPREVSQPDNISPYPKRTVRKR